MPIQEVISDNLRSPAKIWASDLETEARGQIEKLCKLPFLFKHVAVMPDAHWGLGSTVGTVFASKRALIPSAVGVDIGCGMLAHRLNLHARDLPDSLLAMRTAIEAAVPHGRTDNGGVNDRGAWGEAPKAVQKKGWELSTDDRFHSMVTAHPEIVGKNTRAIAQLGTLGGGNHFVELCLDKGDQVWLMLHSGSRGIGNKIGTYFITKAKELMAAYHIELEDPNLAYLPEGTDLFIDYWNALSWAQDYALINRGLMFEHALEAISDLLDRTVESDQHVVSCHHNYAAHENHFGENVYVTRKGAVRARLGDWGIIPGSMGAASFITRGKGNPDSYHSCAHGAGRRMSRREATRQFTVEDLGRQTAGVECRKDVGVLDEIPAAYKDINAVMADQSDLVEVMFELRQVLCVKG